MQPEQTLVPHKFEHPRPSLHVVPEHEPSRRRPAIATIGVVVIIAMVLSGLAVYAWQHANVTDAQASAARSDAQLSAAVDQVAALRTQVAGLRWRVASLQERVGAIGGRRGLLADRLAAVSGRLADTNQQLATTRAEMVLVRERLSAAHGRALVAGGPLLSDGRYVGRVEGIDAGASPPRIALDLRRHAAGAALALPGWRVFPIRAGTSVQLSTWKDEGEIVVTLETFDHIFDGQAPWNATMRDARYWVQVTGGEVTAIGEAT